MNDDQLRAALDDLLGGLQDDRRLPARTAGRVLRRRRLKVGLGGLGTAAAVAGVAALVVASPGQERLTPLPPATRLTTPPTPAPSPSLPPSPLASPSAVPDPSTAPSDEPGAAAPVVVLRPDGLGFARGSSTSALPFGTEATTVREALDRALGAGGERPTPDCGQGSSSVQYESIFLLVQAGEFVGWTTGSPGLSTADGVTVGTTLADLRASMPDVQVSQGTVGTEWSAAGDGGLSGFLDGASDTSVITGITAGVRCIAR